MTDVDLKDPQSYSGLRWYTSREACSKECGYTCRVYLQGPPNSSHRHDYPTGKPWLDPTRSAA